MSWNWELEDWPNFRFDSSAVAPYESEFLKLGGILIGSSSYLDQLDRTLLITDLLTSEAIQTSAIEGEILDRSSVQSSIRHNLGLAVDSGSSKLAEQGIAEMIVDVYQTWEEPLSVDTLFRWHEMVMRGRSDLPIGRYRASLEPMQIVSGPMHNPKVHFEAVPTQQVESEMNRFLDWFNGSEGTSPLARAGIAHLYFESIHPFEDGNGRIGRAISEKALAQGIGQPSLVMLSSEIEARRKAYYRQLEEASLQMEITDWLDWFADTVVAAQHRTRAWIEFVIGKAKLMDRLKGKINERQEKALLRVLAEGPGGFKGGLSASKYMTITSASTATATRDLSDLVELGAFDRTGERKSTRYWIRLSEYPQSETPNTA